MNHSDLMQQARQGDLTALTQLLQRTLGSKGIQPHLSRSASTLHIWLQAEQGIAATAVIPSLKAGFLRLGIPGLDRLEISAGQGVEPEWQQVCVLQGSEGSGDPDPPVNLLQLGALLAGRYRLLRELAQNDRRRTWLAEPLREGAQSLAHPRTVVLKLLPFERGLQWADFKLFQREVRVLQHLDHPLVPKYCDSFEFTTPDHTTWFGLAQTYVPGQSLKKLLEVGHRFTEAEVRRIAADVLSVLVYLHQLSPPLLHRDIKPSNLIADAQGRTHVVDFGSVQDHTPTPGQSFTVVGSYGYAPVEQFGGRAVPASDLYALGATLIHLLTGTPPADLPQQQLKIQFAGRISIAPALARWIDRLIEPAPENRYRTALSALQALQSLQPDEPPPEPKLSGSDRSDGIPPIPQDLTQLTAGHLLAHLRQIQYYHQRSFSGQLLSCVSPIPQRIPKPYGCRIRLDSAPGELRIGLPRRGLYWGDLFPVGLWAVFAAVILSLGSWPFALILWGMAVWGSQVALGCTRLTLRRDYVQMERRFLGIYLRRREPTAAILGAFHEQGQRVPWAVNSHWVTLQVGIKSYRLGGHPLSWVECRWLAQEIQDWLKG
ncbi:serine/threonine protein kinase [Synechococcus sp. Nb3U1]|uniref:serine/threonine protein kinase n=1 Tax=Synechococcus sp. Nb3U1 TaxID=1914529 RepID=UPI001F182C65|nr:serine/threonine-protein kinase [Synechococcus sp. Nb3U1]MCF2971192.1 serine/threonine protein kinase [Synechococcus sp. Nb3U1]